MKSKVSAIQMFAIPGRLPGLNEYTTDCRGSRYKGNKSKQDAQTLIGIAIKAARLRGVQAPVQMVFSWIEKDFRRDPDNVAFAQKFILDALVNAHILPDDSRKWVLKLTHEFPEPDVDNPRIEVIIEEVF